MEGKNIFMFDVESTSLHGTGFAVGAVVYRHRLTKYGDWEWEEIDRLELLSKEGAVKASDWVKGNVIPNLSDMPTCETDRELRDTFFSFYLRHKENSEIWSDVNFPVETNFLSAIVADDPENRQWEMPYPLCDMSTIVNVDINRIEASGLKGLRAHNPLDDAIASVNVLIQAIQN